MVLLERLLTRCASQVEKQRNQDEQNWKAQMDAVHDVLDTKVTQPMDAERRLLEFDGIESWEFYGMEILSQ